MVVKRVAMIYLPVSEVISALYIGTYVASCADLKGQDPESWIVVENWMICDGSTSVVISASDRSGGDDAT